MKHSASTDLAGSEAVTVPPRKVLLESLAAYFDRRGTERFIPVPNIENMEMSALIATPTESSLFGAMITALYEKHAIPVLPTIGGLMGVLALTEGDVHDVGCACLDSPNGATVAERLRRISVYRI